MVIEANGAEAEEAMQERGGTVERVRDVLRQERIGVTVAVPSYGEGQGIVPTLTSLWDGMVQLAFSGATMFLSDSSPGSATVDAARQWASTVGARLVVDHSDRRRSLKQALNVALASCETEVVLVAVADVVVPAASMAHLLEPICALQSADVVVGVAASDPSVTDIRHRAGAFQLNVVRRLVRTGGSSMRAEGALWAAHRRFYGQWRFPIGQGSVADDVELARAVEARGFRGMTVADAVVLKVPPGTIRDFCLQTRRYYFATADDRPAVRSRAEWKAWCRGGSRSAGSSVVRRLPGDRGGDRPALGQVGTLGVLGTVDVDQAGNHRVSRPADGKGVPVGSNEADDPAPRRPADLGASRPDVEPVSTRPAADTSRPRLSAVVVHYNDPEHLVTCVDALWRDPGIDDIVVVDNASDAEAAAAAAACRDVQLVVSPTNLGFGGGANLGATHSTGDLLVFMNPDAVPDPGCMTALAEHLSEHGGVVGPLVRTGPDCTPEYGCTVDRMLLLRAMDQQGEPLYVSGCCLATTRSCFDAVGGFDARYFLFQEDVEFCWQALRRGFAVAVLPAATLVHAGGVAAAGGYRRDGRIETTSSRILLRERNGWAVILACAPGRHILQLLALSILRTVAFTGVLVFYGRPWDAARLWGGLAWNVVHLRATLERRHYPGVTSRGERTAWGRVERQFFLWDLARKGERLRFVDTEAQTSGS